MAAAAAAAEAVEEAIQYRGGWIDPYEMPPVEVGARILDVAKESVAVMCDALELLGDRHAVYGFSGETRHRVDIHVGKDFDDRTSPATWAALSAMKSLKYTRMDPAVRHATAKPGPADPDEAAHGDHRRLPPGRRLRAGPRRSRVRVAGHRAALRDAVAAGVTPYLLTIDPAGHDYLRRMLPDHSYVVIEDVHSLPSELATPYGSVASSSSRGW